MKIIYCLSLAFMCCNSTTEKKNDIEDNQKNKLPFESLLSKAATADSINFFRNCEKLMDHSSMGALQLPNVDKDSTGFFCFAACYDCRESFEIVFDYKGNIVDRNNLGSDNLWKLFNEGCNNDFSKFNCYAFVIPMRDPDKQNNIHASNIDFPSIVKVYKRILDDHWQLIKKQKLKSRKEYISLQFKSIYGIE